MHGLQIKKFKKTSAEYSEYFYLEELSEWLGFQN